MVEKQSSTNPCCEHAPLIEENSRLKAQLEMGLVSCIQGEKSLNDLLSNQKEVIGKEGIGFGAMSSKKKNKKMNKAKGTILSETIKFVKEGEMPKKNGAKAGEGGRATRGNATPLDFGGPSDHFYILRCAYDGHVYAKFVGSYDEYIAWSIWVPKTLVTNMRGPIQEWVPKSNH